jgi:hypothetical protein
VFSELEREEYLVVLRTDEKNKRIYCLNVAALEEPGVPQYFISPDELRQKLEGQLKKEEELAPKNHTENQSVVPLSQLSQLSPVFVEEK